ncbi:MAG: 3-hydroxyisobutyrate dehydrogenase [Pseudomonadota bacterium]
MTKVAFIGLGNMGSGMCANLVKAGYDIVAFDLNAEAVKAAEDVGASGASSIAEAVGQADTIVTMLPAGQHVLSVYFGDEGVTAHAPKGSLLVDCSTIAVEDARQAARLAQDAGFPMVDAPVSGGIMAANAGTLTFMVGGTQDAFDRAQTILESMGKAVIHAGAAGNGQVAKVANNMLLGISMIATCEAFNLAEKLGLDAQTFFDIVSTASGQCWSVTTYCPAPGPVPSAPSNNDYKPGFAVDLMLKDLRLASGAADAIGAPTQFGALARETYEQIAKDGYGGIDFSGVMKRLRGEI